MTRGEAIKVLSSYDVNGVWADIDGKPYNAEEQAEAFDMAIEALSAEPVKHGEWKYHNYSDISNPYCGYNECSICKQHEHIVHKFCPNCGAKMKGQEE